ncbi:hypothetical protein RF11_07186 [Thelohanellus kitauei]|uniref:BPTI/Kunitz inhibitor domain-containing protein n=1 Tax=Thelohanellus kitauei TaxID=669202 RepID=A0A0C2JXN5_THEKT|nr:hypothetical protein RF11_07186 [Thelohanellus kitauei]
MSKERGYWQIKGETVPYAIRSLKSHIERSRSGGLQSTGQRHNQEHIHLPSKAWCKQRYRFNITAFVVYTCINNAESPYFRDCAWSDQYSLYWYDGTSRSCVEFSSCGTETPVTNVFWAKEDCVAECVTPYKVKNERCLIDWGEVVFSRDMGGENLIAFNMYAGACVRYVKMEDKPVPLTFKTYEECKKYCLFKEFR